MRAPLFAVLAAFFLFPQGWPQAQSSEGRMARQNMLQLLERAAEDAVAFGDKQEIQRLKNAEAVLESINLVDEHDPAKRIAIRRKMLEVWLALATQLDRAIDPNFDPGHAPQESLLQPPVDGVSITSNAPENIKDPVARAAFQRAVDQNTKETIRYTHQFELMRFNERLTGKLDFFVRIAYMPSVSDQRELKEALEKAGANQARATRLLAMIVPNIPK